MSYLCIIGLVLMVLACGGGAAATGLASTTERRFPLQSEMQRRPSGLEGEMVRQPPAPLTPID